MFVASISFLDFCNTKLVVNDLQKAIIVKYIFCVKI